LPSLETTIPKLSLSNATSLWRAFTYSNPSLWIMASGQQMVLRLHQHDREESSPSATNIISQILVTRN